MSEREARKTAMTLAEEDQIAYVLCTIGAQDDVTVRGQSSWTQIRATGVIPQFHKIALVAIPKGAKIIREGNVIGRATANINSGDWVHVHNFSSLRPALSESEKAQD